MSWTATAPASQADGLPCRDLWATGTYPQAVEGGFTANLATISQTIPARVAFAGRVGACPSGSCLAARRETAGRLPDMWCVNPRQCPSEPRLGSMRGSVILTDILRASRSRAVSASPHRPWRICQSSLVDDPHCLAAGPDPVLAPGPGRRDARPPEKWPTVRGCTAPSSERAFLFAA